MPKREEDKLMPDQTDTALTPDELTDRASALNALDKSYSLHWLATCGSEHPDGQALLRALAALQRHRDGGR